MSNHYPHRLQPLPPDTEAIETIRILKQVAVSALAIAELKGIAQSIPSQRMLVNAIILKEAKDSSEIENIITSTDELYKALSAKDGKIRPETKEVINYRRSVMMGYEIIQSQGYLRVNDIVELQKDLLSNNAGIRTTPGTVLKNDRTGEVVYVPPQDYNEINRLLSNFIKYYNDAELRKDVSPLIWLAILHYQFESIHPFYDGNGRTGRILNILFLILNNLLDIPILYLSSYIIQNKANYYRLLNTVNKTGEWEEWILFMLKAVEMTSKSTMHQIKNIRNELSRTVKTVKVNSPKSYSKDLIELLFEQPYARIEYVVERLGVTRKTAAKYLNDLKKIGILEERKMGRENLYINIGLYNILQNE